MSDKIALAGHLILRMESVTSIERIEGRPRVEEASTPAGARDRLLASDPGALADLYDAHARRIYGLALWWCGRREEAEDVVQETFVRVWEKRHLVARARDLEAYLLRIAKTVAAGRHRRHKPAEPLGEAVLLLAIHPDAERDLDAERLSHHLHALSPKLRAVVFLHVFLEHTFRQAGAVLGIPTFTAASRYRLAIERLKRLMEVSDV